MSGQKMETWSRSPTGRVVRAASVIAVLTAGAPGCGGRDAEAEEARARLAAEFARRDAEVAGGAALTGDREEGPREGAPERRTAEEDPVADGTSAAAPRDRAPMPDGATRADPDDAGGVGAREPADVAPTPSLQTPDPIGRADAVDPDSILAVADQAYAGLTSLRAAFAQRIENRLIGRTREGRGLWYQAGRNRFLMDFEDPPDDIIVADGTCLWWYEPSLQPDQLPARALEEGAEIGTIDILGSLLSEARRSYEGTYVGAEDVAGTATHHISLTPRQLPARYLSIEVWVGASDHLVRRFRIEEENQTVRTVTLSDLQPQIVLPDSLFEFTRPPDVPVFSSDPQCA